MTVQANPVTGGSRVIQGACCGLSWREETPLRDDTMTRCGSVLLGGPWDIWEGT